MRILESKRTVLIDAMVEGRGEGRTKKKFLDWKWLDQSERKNKLLLELG